jgi:exopolyphosphatase/pppGpp-phosphohydrolase
MHPMYQCLAAIDIGSNTVHLIVAATDGAHLTILADESIFVRLADGVWGMGYITEERIRATVDAVNHLVGVARSFGAQRIITVTTEVARKARNASELISTVRVMCGDEPLVLSGMDEATLTFHGVTHGRHLPSRVAVADLGGGSLEVIIAELSYGTWRTSLPLGSAFMHERFALGDPPLPEAVAESRAYLAETLDAIPQLSRAEELLVSGGTVNALMRLVQQLQHRAAGDRVLRRSDLDAALDVMLAQPAELVAAHYRLRLERARLLPAGAIVLAALADRLQLPGIIVSPAGIREGIILAAAEYGDDWLAGARRGIDQGTFDDAEARAAPAVDAADGHHHHRHQLALPAPDLAYQPAADVAWRLLRDQTEAMLHLRKAALAGDVEAVHDMRVAARRLRTLLEVFQPCFPAADARRLSRAARKLAEALGAVRDADVALEGLATRLHEADPELIPGLRYLIKLRRAERATARRVLRRALQSERIEQFRALCAALRLADEQRVHLDAARLNRPAEAPPASEEAQHA